MPVTFTGIPESFVGEKCARDAAFTAASRSIPGPLRARAETTLPFSSTTTSTCTTPSVRIRRATSGYTGVGRLRALPFSTPPDTGFSKGRGAGGASLSFTTTRLFVSAGMPRKSGVNGWTDDTFILSREVDGGRVAVDLFSGCFTDAPREFGDFVSLTADPEDFELPKSDCVEAETGEGAATG